MHVNFIKHTPNHCYDYGDEFCEDENRKVLFKNLEVILRSPNPWKQLYTFEIMYARLCFIVCIDKLVW